jgi:hypothetical protein
VRGHGLITSSKKTRKENTGKIKAIQPKIKKQEHIRQMTAAESKADRVLAAN